MADNPPAPNPGPRPTLPATGMTGRLKSLTSQLPARKGAGKIVVMLSSVAKPPPANTAPLPRVDPPTNPSSPEVSQTASRPPPLPPKQVSPARGAPPSAPRLSTTTYVKLPPKTNAPMWSSLSGKPVATPIAQASPPPLPVKGADPVPSLRPEPRKPGAQLIPPIKLNEPSAGDDFSGESIFLQPEKPGPQPRPEAPQRLEAANLNLPGGSPQSLDAFVRSQPGAAKPAPEPTPPDVNDKPPALVAPPLVPPQRLAPSPAKAIGALPPVRPPALPPPLTLPVANSPESSPAPQPTLHVAPPLLDDAIELPPEKLPPPLVPPPALQVAPPLLETHPELPTEKLPQPNLLAEVRPVETAADAAETPVDFKVPALTPPTAPPPKPLLPPTSPVAKTTGNWLRKSTPLKTSTPIVISSSSPKVQVPQIVEAKPALKPAVLPSRMLPLPAETEKPATPPPVGTPAASEAAKAPEIADPTATSTPAAPPREATTSVKPPGSATTSTVETGKPVAKDIPAQPPPAVPVIPKTKKILPPTRAERARKRRVWGVVVFYLLLLVTAGALFFGSLHFGRDTRVEGQVIPPPGLLLNKEVWIVNDFHELAAGITEDLAEERTPLRQEIQERQDHVQRTQAEVAGREERIRLLQQQIDASKAEIDSLINQSRDATQQIWDVDGAQIDADYTSHLNQLQKDIADRAKSLNLKYQTDANFESPEVWANAYRLALYEVPAGVDTVKEHQWLGDVMKQWRDYLKTLDDRKQQLRDKAEQVRLAPASKIADLNAKIDDLRQRIDGTEVEETPLKAELQQAQTDLASAQASEAGLDAKYYKQLEVLPEEAIVNHIRIPLSANGRFTWVDDDVFAEGENEHSYWMFCRATRADGREYWVLFNFSIEKNHKRCFLIEPTAFISTKAILRPDLSPEEQEQ